jgi:hypothetical protein
MTPNIIESARVTAAWWVQQVRAAWPHDQNLNPVTLARFEELMRDTIVAEWTRTENDPKNIGSWPEDLPPVEFNAGPGPGFALAQLLEVSGLTDRLGRLVAADNDPWCEVRFPCYLNTRTRPESVQICDAATIFCPLIFSNGDH